MGFFDTLKSAAGDLAGQEAHEALGGLLAGTSVGGMSGLLDQLKQGGLDDAVKAWTAGDDHPAVSPDQIKDALGGDHLRQIASTLGVSPDEAAQHLADHLPDLAAAHAASEAAPADDTPPADDVAPDADAQPDSASEPAADTPTDEATAEPADA